MLKVVSQRDECRSFTYVVRDAVPVIFSLFDCPPVDGGNFVFVYRDESGTKSVLGMGRAATCVPSLNLAAIRQRGATLGANEVHLIGAGLA